MFRFNFFSSIKCPPIWNDLVIKKDYHKLFSFVLFDFKLEVDFTEKGCLL